jgi:hypothetical protein
MREIKHSLSAFQENEENVCVKNGSPGYFHTIRSVAKSLVAAIESFFL